MSQELFRKIINELSEMDYMGEITLHRFGEPLLDLRLDEFIRIIKEKCKKARVNLHTNGTLLTYKRFKELCDDGVGLFTITQHENSLSDNNLEIFEKATKKERKKINFTMGAEIYKINRGGLLESKRFEDNSNLPCFAPRRMFVVNTYGKVVLCCNDYHSKEIMGDLNKESILDVWNSERFKVFRTELAKGNRDISKICKVCDCDFE